MFPGTTSSWNSSEGFPDFGSLLLLPACFSPELVENPSHRKKNPSKQHNSIFYEEQSHGKAGIRCCIPLPLITPSQLSALGMEEAPTLRGSTLINIKNNRRREKMLLHQSRSRVNVLPSTLLGWKSMEIHGKDSLS